MAVSCPLKIYLAGKIEKNCWRHDIAPGLRGATSRGSADTVLPNITTCGPFFMSCDHGCAHGPSTHGLAPTCSEGGDEGFDKRARPSSGALIKTWLCKADEMFVWLDDDALTAHGTIMEIGWASAHGMPIRIGMHRKRFTSLLERELWLPLSAATTITHAETARQAFITFYGGRTDA